MERKQLSLLLVDGHPETRLPVETFIGLCPA